MKKEIDGAVFYGLALLAGLVSCTITLLIMLNHRPDLPRPMGVIGYFIGLSGAIFLMKLKYKPTSVWD